VPPRRIRDILLLRLQREQRHRLINRLIAFLLFFAIVYFLLLFLLMLLDFPLLLFHFLLFSYLSLLPLFLILEPETEHSIAVLRRFDRHAQIEAFLSTTSAEHRSFLEPRVRSLLLKPEAVLRFRLTKTNRLVAIGVLCLLVLVQLASLAAFQRPSLNAKTVKNLRTKSEITTRRESEKAEQHRGGPAAEIPEAGIPAEGSADKPSQRREHAGETRAMDRELPPGESDQELGGAETSSAPTEGQSEQSFPWAPLPLPEEGEGSALKGALEQGPDPASRRGDLPAGSGETGEALMDSPLQEYSASSRREIIETEGGTTLQAESSSVPPKESPVLQALFADFPSLVGGQVGFDPAIERIRRLYMKLLNERY
jgi:hypothetical protein